MQTIEEIMIRRPPAFNARARAYYDKFAGARESHYKSICLAFCWFFVTHKRPRRALFAQYFSSLYNCERRTELKQIWRRYYFCYATKWKKSLEYKKIKVAGEEMTKLPRPIQDIIYEFYYGLVHREQFSPALHDLSRMRIQHWTNANPIIILFQHQNYRIITMCRIVI